MIIDYNDIDYTRGIIDHNVMIIDYNDIDYKSALILSVWIIVPDM